MVLDTSVLAHIMFAEEGWENTVHFLEEQNSRQLSAASLVELQAATSSRIRGEPYETVSQLLRGLRIHVIDLTSEHADIARKAWLTFGRGTGHPARLNYGDLMAYALAKVSGEPLAYVGSDFGHTDLETVRLPR